MTTHIKCFHGEIRKYRYFSIEKKKMPYLELWATQESSHQGDSSENQQYFDTQTIP